MITTKDINVDLEKGQDRLRRITTKDVDASIVKHLTFPIIMSIDGILQEIPEGFEAELSKKKSTGISIASTRNLSDVADIVEKRRRDDIAAESKVKRADEKELRKLNMQFVFVDVDDLIQAFPRRELK